MLRLVLSTAFCFILGEAMSCTCFFFRPITVEALLYDGLVFTGRVVEVNTTYTTFEGQRYPEKSVATFVVDKWFSAHDISDTVTLNTGGGIGDCGLTFNHGEKWLIYADQWEGIVYTSGCTPSQKISNNSDKSFLKALQRLNHFTSMTGRIEDKSEWVNGPYTIKGTLLDGKPTGEWFRIRDRDTIAVFNFNSAGERHGYQMEKNEDYGETFEFYYERTGTAVKVHSKRKELIQYYELQDGIRNGTYEEYSEGDLRLRARYVNGKLDGEWISWHEDGAIAKGKIKTIKRFQHDKLLSSVRYDESGNVIKY